MIIGERTLADICSGACDTVNYGQFRMDFKLSQSLGQYEGI
jgi:hypothetical protein